MESISQLFSLLWRKLPSCVRLGRVLARLEAPSVHASEGKSLAIYLSGVLVSDYANRVLRAALLLPGIADRSWSRARYTRRDTGSSISRRTEKQKGTKKQNQSKKQKAETTAAHKSKPRLPQRLTSRIYNRKLNELPFATLPTAIICPRQTTRLDEKKEEINEETCGRLNTKFASSRGKP